MEGPKAEQNDTSRISNSGGDNPIRLRGRSLPRTMYSVRSNTNKLAITYYRTYYTMHVIKAYILTTTSSLQGLRTLSESCSCHRIPFELFTEYRYCAPHSGGSHGAEAAMVKKKKSRVASVGSYWCSRVRCHAISQNRGILYKRPNPLRTIGTKGLSPFRERISCSVHQRHR